MIEVLFSDSAAGALKHALQDSKHSETRICSLFVCADMGDISNLTDFQSRREFWRQVFDEGDRDEGWQDKHINMLSQAHDSLMQAAGQGEQIRVWWTDTPADICGLYWLMHELRETPCRIDGIHVPMIQPMHAGSFKTLGTLGESTPEDMRRYMRLSESITQQWRDVYSLYWQRLARENAPLRAMVNGLLRSVPMDFYDSFIRQALHDMQGEFKAALLLGNCLGKGPAGGLECWYRLRIKHMIDEGILRVLENETSFYDWVLAAA